MTKEQLFEHTEKIKMMSREQIDEFAATVHNALPLDTSVKNTLLDAIDERISKLNNSFALEVEMSELRVGEL